MSIAGAVGSRKLFAVTLHFERKSIAPWIAIATLLSVSSVIVYPWIFSTDVERAGFAATVGANPALGLIFGPAFDLSTTDGFNSWRSLALGGFFTALGMIFLVTKTVRMQEDNGQAELLASGVMGRSSRLLVGILLGLFGSVAVGVVSGILTVACGGGLENSMLLCLTFTASGFMFTGVAAVTAQVGAEAKTANTLAVGTLGVLFILRGFCYSIEAPNWSVWINPLGWMTQTRPASGNNWWPFLLSLALTAALCIVAFFLQSRRDFGQGIIAPRPGPAVGHLRSSWSFLVRINQSHIVMWVIAAIGLGVIFGYFAGSVKDLLLSNPAISHILASGSTSHQDLVSSFLVTILSLAGIIMAVPGVQIVTGIRREENDDRLEPIIVAGGSRRRHYLAAIALAALTSAGCLMITGVVASIVAVPAEIGLDHADVIVQALVTIPATWAVIGVAVAVVGLKPHLSIAAWAGVVASFALTLLGPTFNLWNWVLAISPFWHVPNVQSSSATWLGLSIVFTVFLIFATLGVVGFRRRDLAV